MPAVRGDEIRDRRLRLGLKKTELAEQCRITHKALDNLEHERRPASIEVVYRLANALGVEAKDLLAKAGDAA